MAEELFLTSFKIDAKTKRAFILKVKKQDKFIKDVVESLVKDWVEKKTPVKHYRISGKLMAVYLSLELYKKFASTISEIMYDSENNFLRQGAVLYFLIRNYLEE